MRNYPSAKTPVPNRNTRDREAPRISKVLSGLIPNRFGSGGLKFAGAEKLGLDVEILASKSPTVGSEISVEALMRNDLFGIFRQVSGRRIGICA